MSLAAQLEAMKQKAKEKIPAETLAKMQEAVDELRNSGILEKALAAGSTVPVFELPDEHDEPVSSTNLLADGPLVLTFYRGSW
jgi:hypothetical protein